MSKILLPTIDYSPQQGGVARYLSAIKKTFPDDIDVLYWKLKLGRREMFREILSFSKDYKQLWTSHVLPIGTMAYFAKRITHVPYVVFLHGMDFDLARRNFWKEVLTKRVLRNAKRVITNSEALAREVEAFAKISHPLVVYPTLADAFLDEGLRYDIAKKSLREGGKVRLLTVSRLVQRKGHEKVLKAIKHLPNVEYWIVGEGNYRARIEMRVKDLGLQDRVRMFGMVSDQELTRIYKEADIFVMPTTRTPLDREGFGIVYLEAQLFGLPVIASNHPGVSEAVVDRVTGYLVDNITDLRASIHRLVEDTDTRRKMGFAGREYVLTGFTRERQCEKLKELF